MLVHSPINKLFRPETRPATTNLNPIHGHNPCWSHTVHTRRWSLLLPATILVTWFTVNISIGTKISQLWNKYWYYFQLCDVESTKLASMTTLLPPPYSCRLWQLMKKIPLYLWCRCVVNLIGCNGWESLISPRSSNLCGHQWGKL